MSGSRERRLERLIDLMQRKLDQAVGALAQARTAEQEARQQVLALTNKLAAANRGRYTAMLSGASAQDWGVHHTWEQSLEMQRQQAMGRVAEAQQMVARARQKVMEARSEVSRVQTLLARIVAARRAEEARVERKQEDEIAARKAAAPDRLAVKGVSR